MSKVSEVIIWQNGNVMAFNENYRQIGECQGCILDPELIKNLNEYCDETTKFYMAIFDAGSYEDNEDTYTRRYEMDVSWWFKKKKEEEVNRLANYTKEIRNIQIAKEKENKEKEMDKWFESLTILQQADVAYNFWDGATYEQKEEEYEIE